MRESEQREEEGRLDVGRRKNPHPPNCVGGCICIDYPSLFFQKYNMTEMSYKNSIMCLKFFLGKKQYDRNVIFVLEN